MVKNIFLAYLAYNKKMKKILNFLPKPWTNPSFDFLNFLFFIG